MIYPTVSIIMSVYNTNKEYLIECIDSILSQSYRDFEFIIIDDGSNDETKKILSKYSNDYRVKLFCNDQNAGLTKNLNRAIALSHGKYIARMDADDIAEKDRLQEQVRYLDRNKDISIVATYYHLIENGKQRKPKEQAIGPEQNKARWFFTNNGVMHASVMMRSSIINMQDGLSYDDHFKKTQDYDLWTRVSKNYKIAILPKYLMNYRISENQISKKNSGEQMQFYDEVIIRQARELNGNLTDDQLRVHLNICRGRRNLSSKEVYNWNRTLVRQNKIRKLYQTESYNYYTHYFCYRNSIKSIRTIKDVIYSLVLVGMYLFSIPKFKYREKLDNSQLIY